MKMAKTHGLSRLVLEMIWAKGDNCASMIHTWYPLSFVMLRSLLVGKRLSHFSFCVYKRKGDVLERGNYCRLMQKFILYNKSWKSWKGLWKASLLCRGGLVLYSVRLTCRRSGFDPRTGQTCKSLFLKQVMTAPLLSARQQVWAVMTIIKGSVSQYMWHIQEPSLLNGQECRV